MKRIIFISIALLAITTSIYSQESSDVILEAFRAGVEAKVSESQQLIGFSDEQASKVKEIQLEFLKEVRKAENCLLCNKKKRMRKLVLNRDAELQKVLSREQYIKYDAIENGRIKKSPLWL